MNTEEKETKETKETETTTPETNTKEGKKSKKNKKNKAKKKDEQKERRRSRLREIANLAKEQPHAINDVDNPLNDKKSKRALAAAIVMEIVRIGEKRNFSPEKRREVAVSAIAHSGILYLVGSKFKDELKGYEVEASRYAAWAETQALSQNGYTVQHEDKVAHCKKFAQEVVKVALAKE